MHVTDQTHFSTTTNNKVIFQNIILNSELPRKCVVTSHYRDTDTIKESGDCFTVLKKRQESNDNQKLLSSQNLCNNLKKNNN